MSFLTVMLKECPHCGKEIEVEIQVPKIDISKAGKFYGDRRPEWIRFTDKMGEKNIRHVLRHISRKGMTSCKEVYKKNDYLTKKQFEKVIELLKRRGDVFEPQEGYVTRI